MRANQVKAEAPEIPKKPCGVCGEMTSGYGRLSGKVSCSRTCDQELHRQRDEAWANHIRESGNG